MAEKDITSLGLSTYEGGGKRFKWREVANEVAVFAPLVFGFMELLGYHPPEKPVLLWNNVYYFFTSTIVFPVYSVLFLVLLFILGRRHLRALYCAFFPNWAKQEINAKLDLDLEPRGEQIHFYLNQGAFSYIWLRAVNFTGYDIKIRKIHWEAYISGCEVSGEYTKELSIMPFSAHERILLKSDLSEAQRERLKAIPDPIPSTSYLKLVCYYTGAFGEGEKEITLNAVEKSISRIG